LCSQSFDNFSIKLNYILNYKQALKSKWCNCQLSTLSFIKVVLKIIIGSGKMRMSTLKIGNMSPTHSY
jgi:hypothetical protein